MITKRLRIFAGPNGSGKSVLFKYLISQHYFNKYYYVNADEISKHLTDGYSFSNWPIQTSLDDFTNYINKTGFKNLINESEIKNYLSVDDSVFTWKGKNENLTYISACIADYLRNKLLDSQTSFACETVFSHPSKINFIQTAKEKGFKIYLYFIATSSPIINKDRVENRVNAGGHNVPADKIESRYYRCLENLYEALKICDDVYLFDNSKSKTDLTYNNFAHIKNHECNIVSDDIPEWFIKYVYNKLMN